MQFWDWLGVHGGFWDLWRLHPLKQALLTGAEHALFAMLGRVGRGVTPTTCVIAASSRITSVIRGSEPLRMNDTSTPVMIGEQSCWFSENDS
jgi:hypothetical protein